MKYLISIIVNDPIINNYSSQEATIAFTDVTYKVGSTSLTLELAAAAEGVTVTPLGASS